MFIVMKSNAREDEAEFALEVLIVRIEYKLEISDVYYKYQISYREAIQFYDSRVQILTVK